MDIELKFIGAYDGFGSGAWGYIDKSEMRMLLKDINSTLIRWGGLPPNNQTLKENTGTAPLSIADFFSFGVDSLDGKVLC